jgi:hypothetical protein
VNCAEACAMEIHRPWRQGITEDRGTQVSKTDTNQLNPAAASRDPPLGDLRGRCRAFLAPMVGTADHDCP